jgi:hypothetical protein
MSYTVPFTHLRIVGTLGSVSSVLEEWSCGFKIPSSGTAPAESAILAFLQAVDPAVRAFHPKTNVDAGVNAIYTGLTGAFIGQDGKYMGGATQRTQRLSTAGGPIGGTGPNYSPFSTSSVYSLRTAIPRGRGHAGRVYYPALGRSLANGDGRWEAGACAQAAAQMSVLIVAINAAANANLGSNGGVSVMSNIGSGVTSKVTSVLVGRVPDNMRSRRKGLVEDYQSSAISTEIGAELERRNTPIGLPV